VMEFVFAYRTKTDFAHPLLPRAMAKNFHDLDYVSFGDPTGNRSQINFFQKFSATPTRQHLTKGEMASCAPSFAYSCRSFNL